MKNTEKKSSWQKFIPYTSGILFAILLIASGITIKYRNKQYLGDLIFKDVSNLVRIFETINRDCIILGFDYQKNPINFLNIKSFSGSEVGPMNLLYPKKWRGPYATKNPTMEGIEYQIIHTRQGYFIAPGQGVKLPNGKIIGKDILFDEQADIIQMAKDPYTLNFQNKPFALQLYIGKQALD